MITAEQASVSSRGAIDCKSMERAVGKGPSQKYKPGIGHQENTPMNEGKGKKKWKHWQPPEDWVAPAPASADLAKHEAEMLLWADLEKHYEMTKNGTKVLVTGETHSTHDGLYEDLKKMSQNFPSFVNHPGKITIDTEGAPYTLNKKIHALFGPKLKQMIDQDVPDHLLIKFSFDYSVECQDWQMYISLTAQKHEVLVQKMKFTQVALEDNHGMYMQYQIIDNVKYLVGEFEKKYLKKISLTMPMTSFKAGDMISLFGGSDKTAKSNLAAHFAAKGSYEKSVSTKQNNLSAFPAEVQMPPALANHLKGIFDPFGGDVTYGEYGMVTIMMGDQVSHIEITPEEDWDQIHNTVVNVAIGLRQWYGLDIADWMYKDPTKVQSIASDSPTALGKSIPSSQIDELYYMEPKSSPHPEPKNTVPHGKFGSGMLSSGGISIGKMSDLTLDFESNPPSMPMMKGFPVEKLVEYGVALGVQDHFNTSFGKDKWSVLINMTPSGWVYDLASDDEHMMIKATTHGVDASMMGGYPVIKPVAPTKPPVLSEEVWLDAGLKLSSKLLLKKNETIPQPHQGPPEAFGDIVHPMPEKFFSSLLLANMETVLGTDKWTLAKIECPFDDGHEYVLKAHGLTEKVYLTDNQEKKQNLKHICSLMATKIMDQLKGMTTQPPQPEEEMVVAINKGKTEAQQVVIPKIAPVEKTDEQALIDELGTLNEKLEEIEAKAIMKRVEEIRKQLLQSIAPNFAGQEVTFEGVDYVATFAPNANEYKVTDKEGLMNKITLPMFLAIAKIGVMDLKKYLSENEMAVYGTTTATGARVMKTKKKA